MAKLGRHTYSYEEGIEIVEVLLTPSSLEDLLDSGGLSVHINEVCGIDIAFSAGWQLDWVDSQMISGTETQVRLTFKRKLKKTKS